MYDTHTVTYFWHLMEMAGILSYFKISGLGFPKQLNEPA